MLNEVINKGKTKHATRVLIQNYVLVKSDFASSEILTKPFVNERIDLQKLYV